MTTCRRDESASFLAGTLTSAEESTFVDHLEFCARCRQWLEQDAGDEQIWQSARELLKFSCGHAPSQELVGDGPPETVSKEIFRASETLDLSSLTFLTPSDDPAMIGRVGPYEIPGVLGRGATGIVLKGFDRALNRNVAIKVLDPAIAGMGAARQRFAREARAMAGISHEHVVPIYGVDEHAGLPYFAMEYVAGGSLERRLRTEGIFDVVSIVRIGLQIAQALATAHAQGLVHRDIKPENILIDRGTERIRVADFGLARIASDVSCTRSGFVAGTPQYMAPEQVRGESCDGQSDLFSLGGVMYALCTGHAPFRAETVYAVMQRIVQDEPRSIREQNSLIPIWLEKFILRLLAKDKAVRFASADEVVSLLEAELSHLQNPDVAPEPARPWSVRASPRLERKLRASLVAGGLLAAVGITGAIAVWLQPKRRAESNGAANENEIATRPAGEVGEPAVAVPLWGADGTGQTCDLAQSLEREWHSPSGTAAVDFWSHQTTEIRRRAAKLSAELESASAAGKSGVSTSTDR